MLLIGSTPCFRPLFARHCVVNTELGGLDESPNCIICLFISCWHMTKEEVLVYQFRRVNAVAGPDASEEGDSHCQSAWLCRLLYLLLPPFPSSAWQSKIRSLFPDMEKWQPEVTMPHGQTLVLNEVQ